LNPGCEAHFNFNGMTRRHRGGSDGLRAGWLAGLAPFQLPSGASIRLALTVSWKLVHLALHAIGRSFVAREKLLYIDRSPCEP
jgi:hypothetical protein